MLRAKRSALNAAGPCQSPELLASSAPYPRFLTRLRLLSWYREREGLFAALRRMAIVLVPGLRTARRKTARLEVWEDEIQSLQPGEWIEVQSRDEIISTLDQNAKRRGLRFVPEMYDFCGRQFRVFMRDEKICMEIARRPSHSRIRFYSRGRSVRGRYRLRPSLLSFLARSMATQGFFDSFGRQNALSRSTTSRSTVAFSARVKTHQFSCQSEWHLTLVTRLYPDIA